MNEISFRQLLKASWAMYKPVWGTFTTLFLALLVFSVGASFWQGGGVLLSIITMIVSAFVSFLLGYVAVYTANNEKVGFGKMFSNHSFSLFLTSIWASVILFLILHVPFQLILIFGIMGMGAGPVAIVVGAVLLLAYLVLSLNFSFAKFLIIKPELKAWPAIKASWHLARKHQAKIIWIFVAMFFFNILGILAFGVGILITAPVSMIIMAVLVKTLDTENVPKVAEPVMATPDLTV